MFDINFDDFENIKIVYERIKEEKRYLQVTVLWKQDFEFNESEETSIFLEIHNEKRQIFEMRRIGASRTWAATLKIRSTLADIYSFDNMLTIKIAKHQVKQYQPIYSYAS